MLNARAPGDYGRKADPLVVLEWLNATLERADNPAFLRSGGVPVVFVWQMASLSRIGWLNVLGELAKQGKKVRLVGDARQLVRSVAVGRAGVQPEFPVARRSRAA